MADREEQDEQSGRSDEQADDFELVEIRKGEDPPDKKG
jgi:hypothetical protein